MEDNNLIKKVIFFVILSVLTFATNAYPEEYYLFDRRGQNLSSPENIRELARIHYARARDHYRRGEYSEAQAELQKVLQLQPEHQGAQWYLKSVEKELAKYEEYFRTPLQKYKEKKEKQKEQRRKIRVRRQTQDDTLNITEKYRLGRADEKFRQEKKAEKQRSRFFQKLGNVWSQKKTDEIGKRANILQLRQLQKEKQRLETRLRKYQQQIEKQRYIIERIQEQSGQKELLLSKEREAERKRLASQLEKLTQQQKEFEKSLRDKFEKKIDELTKKIESYQAKLEVKKDSPKLKQLEQTAQELKMLQREKEELEIELARLRQTKQELLKVEPQEQQQRKIWEDRLTKIKAEEKKKEEEKELQRKIELHYIQGKRHFRNKDYIAARKEFKDILILDPSNKYALNALEKVEATIAREEKMFELAYKRQEEVKKQRQQKIINEYFAQGKIYYYQEKYREAMEKFGRILFLEPNNTLAEKYIVRCKRKLMQAKRRQKRQKSKKEEAERKAIEEAQITLVRQSQRVDKEMAGDTEKQINLKKEQRRKAKEEKLAQRKAEKERQLQLRQQAAERKRKARQERIARLKKEKEQRLRKEKNKAEQKAIEEAQATLKLDQKNKQTRLKLKRIRELYEKGKDYLNRDLYLEAIACFEQVIKLGGNPSIYLMPQSKMYLKRAKTKIKETKKEAAQEIAKEEVKRKTIERLQKLQVIEVNK
jgi:tetratricopeptide (TPR) repeat protein